MPATAKRRCRVRHAGCGGPLAAGRKGADGHVEEGTRCGKLFGGRVCDRGAAADAGQCDDDREEGDGLLRQRGADGVSVGVTGALQRGGGLVHIQVFCCHRVGVCTGAGGVGGIDNGGSRIQSERVDLGIRSRLEYIVLCSGQRDESGDRSHLDDIAVDASHVHIEHHAVNVFARHR
eukprot:gnl/Ergobibamus_cyprinoides/4512.p2 GENE.gnl/Ergobibamus_cyprinoides/4512~~gnl/Ergobibamus_cyprinoides/4512.p2  ORF type:complete len:177 (+),score=13.13 gnl/Ergobibamus_cyprinoides/4512:276-806(+)